MPVNKNALIRYFIIDECLSSGKKEYYSLKDLEKAFLLKDLKVAERTIRRDISDMINNTLLGYNAPIKKFRTPKGHFKGYFYDKSGFSIRNLNFTEEQLKAFDFVIRQLLEYADLNVMQEFCGAIEKVVGVFTQLRNKDLAACIQYEKVPTYEGLQHRNALVDAILKNEIVKIKYTTFKRSKAYTHVIEPYLLKEYKNWWYILGLQHNRKLPIVLALDRIDSIVRQEKQYTNTNGFKASHYFDNIIGVTATDGPVEKVVLQVTKDLSNYIKKVAMHSSQTILEENETHVIIQLRVQDNYELKSTILSHGRGIKVLEPLSLQNEIKAIHFDCCNQY